MEEFCKLQLGLRWIGSQSQGMREANCT